MRIKTTHLGKLRRPMGPAMLCLLGIGSLLSTASSCSLANIDCATSDAACRPELFAARPRAASTLLVVPAGLESGLYAWYPLNGTLSDLSGNSNHGFLPGGPWPASSGPAFSTGRLGGLEQAASFNGTNQLFASNFAPKCDQDFTVALWLNSALAGNNRIMGTQTTPAQNPGALFHLGPGGALTFTAFWVAGGSNIDGIDGASPAAISVSTWTHVAYVHDGATRHGNLWVNGVSVAATANFGAFAGCTTGTGTNQWWNGTPFNIGYAYAAAFFTGSMEDIWFYLGRKLTGAELSTLMAVQ